MFELVTAYEIAKSEENPILRKLCIMYTKNKLKNVFFKKFDIHHISITDGFLNELYQLYDCIGYRFINEEYPYIKRISENRSIFIKYYEYDILITVLRNQYNIDISKDNTHTITIHPDKKYFDVFFIKEILLMVIYNYCVSYIYGENSDLYIDDDSYRNSLRDLFR